MGKSAGKKGKPPAAAAARVIAQKARTEIRDNPFEVKINKQKFNVLGRKTGKHDLGLPGVSESKALKRRKDTILVEYQRRGKVSVFMDKKTLYNLNEEEELTHYGQSLANSEKLNDTVDRALSGDYRHIYLM
uniref:Uncharacterized protein n=1 Tax=Xenopus tropicalis TaxID=8364 RepID=A0A6I8SWJ8_XENTR